MLCGLALSGPCRSGRRRHRQPLVASATPIADAIADRSGESRAADPQQARPVAIEYSDGHETRAKIHKYTSWATLPLIGDGILAGPAPLRRPEHQRAALRGVHGAVGAGLIGLFAVQSVTGAWNLLEASSAPGHKKRLTHGLIMLAAEGGFIAAAAMAPGHSRNDLINFDANKSTHRNVALVSIGVGTAGLSAHAADRRQPLTRCCQRFAISPPNWGSVLLEPRAAAHAGGVRAYRRARRRRRRGRGGRPRRPRGHQARRRRARRAAEVGAQHARRRAHRTRRGHGERRAALLRPTWTPTCRLGCSGRRWRLSLLLSSTDSR